MSSKGVASRQLGFFVMFSTNRHIWRIVRLSCKFQKLSNFANSDFSVFLHESAHLVTFGSILRISKILKFVKRPFFSYFSKNLAIFRIILQISKICKFGKLEVFSISQRISTLGGVWGHFANFRNSPQFQNFFSEKFLLLWLRWNLCKNNGLD